jgi:hypothetical protein
MLIEKLPAHQLNEQDVFAQTALYFAAKSDQEEIALELLKI